VQLVRWAVAMAGELMSTRQMNQGQNVLGRECNLDDLVRRRHERILGDVKGSATICAIKDLHKGRNNRGNVGDIIDLPLGLIYGHEGDERQVEVGRRSLST
jgi:hypothetical protein